MKKTSILVLLILIATLSVVNANSEEQDITILFTHDLHDHFIPSKGEENNSVVQLGGYARLKTIIDEERGKSENVVLLDAGDYSMGTLFQTVFSSEAPELRLMGQMGYDVTTLGNHEFDFSDAGLAKHLNSAKNSGDKLPQIVSSNIKFPENKNMTDSLLDLKEAMSAYGVKEYTVIERSGIKIGIFGLIGKEAASFAPNAGVDFSDYIESANKTVEKLKSKEKVDIIICLSHCGTAKDIAISEDEQLAKKVKGIDVIISAHSHTRLDKPIIYGNCIIGSCGSYGYNLGAIKLSRNSNEKWKLEEYKLNSVDKSLGENLQINEQVNKYKAIVQKNYLDRFNFKFNEVLAKTPYSFTTVDEMGLKNREEPLGNLITDSYIYSVKKTEGENYEKITAAVVTYGVIRNSFVKGDITVDDVFNTSSLGIGKDGTCGYPLISAYLTGKELRDLCEVDASISPILNSAQLYISGISFTYNPNRMIFNRVTNVNIQNENGTLESIDDSKLYRLVTSLYNAQMLSLVGEKSYGLLSIVPKNKNGMKITNYEDHIVYYNSDGNEKELKEWFALAEYLKSFKKTGGVPEVPEYYNKVHQRKNLDNNKSIIAIINKPNSIAIKLYTVIFILIAVIIFVIYMFIKRKKRKKSLKQDSANNKKNSF